MTKRVGVLAIQGGVELHARALERIGAHALRVLRPADFDNCDALILPGGESTTIAKGMDRLKLWEPLGAFARSGRPLLGTCAGAILLARESRLQQPLGAVNGLGGVRQHPGTLGLMDVVARRNAYGTQVDSFAAPADEGAIPALAGFRCVFIRAPVFEELGPAVSVLARQDGRPVLLRCGSIWAASFHPELGDDPRLHALWLGRAASQARPAPPPAPHP